MNENGTKRREWVKNAAIVFLTVMLLLTFFSQTIMNYSLPEVATQYVQSGTITAKIRGSGTVESGDPYEVKVTETRKVASVAVRTGDVVEKGAVLYYLEDEDSDELKTALEALEKAEADYEKAMLSTELTSSEIQAAESGISIEDYRVQISAKQNAVKAAENAVKMAENEVKQAQNALDAIKQRYDAFTLQISIEQNNNDDGDSGERHTRDWAREELANAENNRNGIQDEINRIQQRINEIVANWEAGKAEFDQAGLGAFWEESDQAKELLAQRAVEDANLLASQTNLEIDKTIVAQKAKVLEEAQANLDARKAKDKEDIINGLKYQQGLIEAEQKQAQDVLTRKQQAVTDRQKDLTDRQKELTDLNSQIGRVSGLQAYQDAIDKAQEKVDELKEKTTGATITAPISGTITKLNVTAGNTTSAATPVAVMQPEGKGYTLSFSVTNEQARRLSVGDKADLVNAWRYDDLEVTLSSIKPDTTDPGQKKLLTFDVTGSSVTAGQSLNLSVGQKSANYDLIVPNSAIREDNNGKFILIVESKSSPLGTRYTASRVDVEVLASDDTQSAISAALYGYEFVITTSTKPVEAGKLVRLASN